MAKAAFMMIDKRVGPPNRFFSLLVGLLNARAAMLTGVCFVGAVLAQYFVDRRKFLVLAVLAYAVLGILFAGLNRGQTLTREERTPSEDASRVRWWLVFFAILLEALAFVRFADNHFHWDGTLLWGLGLLLLVLVSWTPRAFAQVHAARISSSLISRKGLTLRWRHLALLGIIAIGAFYRFYQLHLIPLEMGCDLPLIYENIRLILHKEFLVFFPSHPGREGLFFYWAALLARIWGLSHLTIKLASASVGVLTLPMVYLLGKELFNREVGFYAAFFLSVSHWHIILTRVGYRACLVPMFLALAWYFLVCALKTRRRWFYALSGLFLGLGLHTYNAFMIAPLMLGFMIVGAWLMDRARFRAGEWRGVMLLILVAVSVLVPLLRYAYDEPEMYGYRAATRITSLESALPSDILGTLVTNIGKAFAMFNYRGDAAFVANVPYLRELGFFTAVLFVLGVFAILWRWREGYNLTVLVSLGTMLLPTALSLAFPQEVPNAIRAIGALPAAMILPGVGLYLVRNGMHADKSPVKAKTDLTENEVPTLYRLWRAARGSIPAALVSLILVIEAISVYPIYFEQYASQLPGRNYAISLEMARAIDGFADDGESYSVIWPYWYDGNAVRAQLRRVEQTWHNELDALNPGEPPLAGEPGKFMVMVHPDDEDTLRTLRDAFPKGIALAHEDNLGDVAFITFYGERPSR